ncbi:MAG: hypothetical protein LW854_14970 [Rubrivivax sp.]|nr:hypothetical protein [Rubrivivax sp.]
MTDPLHPKAAEAFMRNVPPTCTTARESWTCKNMLPVDGDTSMTHEHYACKVCGRRMALDYEEMK